MKITFHEISRAVADWAAAHAIEVRAVNLAKGKAGEFNGVTVTMKSGDTDNGRLHVSLDSGYERR